MFALTPAAARQIQLSAHGGDMQDLALRIAARVDAQGDVEYGMGFDEPNDEDMKLELEGVAVVIAEEFQHLLDTIVLDFVELEPGEFNFIFADGLLGSDSSMPSGSCGVGGGGGGGGGGCGGGGGSCGGGGCGSNGRGH